jgi:hypothetical protein
MSWIVVTEEDERRTEELVWAEFHRRQEEIAKMPRRKQCPCCGAVTNKPWENLFALPVMGTCPNVAKTHEA